MGGKDVEVHWWFELWVERHGLSIYSISATENFCPIFEPKPKWLKNLSRWVLPINSVMSPVVTCEGESRCCQSVQVWMMMQNDNIWQQLWCSEGKVASLLDVQWWSMMYKGWIHSKEGFNISPCLMLVRIWVWYANFLQHCVTLTAANPYRQLSAEFQALMEDVGK